MTRKLSILGTYLAVIFFPWPVSVCFALGLSIFEPFMPLSVGLFIDVLYYVPSEGVWPLFTLYGALATILAFFVRSRLKTSIIGE